MNRILLLSCLLICTFSSHAQRVFLGINRGSLNSAGYNGNITTYDSNGQNPTILHEFLDFSQGIKPNGKLFLASNGKLYGMTNAGGNQINLTSFGVLYEYDLVFDRYTVIHLR
jgi:hypothetical protein